MGFPPIKMKTCIECLSDMEPLTKENQDLELACEMCLRYGLDRDYHYLPYPCKTCGQDFEVGQIISSKGKFKTGKFVNCKECREKRK